MFIVKCLIAVAFMGLIFFILALVSIPVVLAVAMVVAAVKLALFIVTIPFRLVGWALGLAVGR